MPTQIQAARQGHITRAMAAVADREGHAAEWIRQRVAEGRIVIPCNPMRPGQVPVGIGHGLRTKVNASLGTSSDICDLDLELRKTRIAEAEGADALMELSAGGDHITAAIGAAESARCGADLICYITPAEHLALEKRAALARRDSKWVEHMDLLLFPERAREIRASRMPAREETCTMCGDFCANRKGMELFRDCIAPDKRS